MVSKRRYRNGIPLIIMGVLPASDGKNREFLTNFTTTLTHALYSLPYTEIVHIVSSNYFLRSTYHIHVDFELFVEGQCD